ncbi:MAG: hypothetical protein RIQ83_3215 [Pseudomonadota bacterium]|jgi:hypothetical protein
MNVGCVTLLLKVGVMVAPLLGPGRHSGSGVIT